MLRQGRVLAPVLTLPGTPAAHQEQTLVAFFHGHLQAGDRGETGERTQQAAGLDFFSL